MPANEHEQSTSSSCHQACDILRATDDGDALAPEHLKLVELAVNGLLNETGAKLFSELHTKVTGGTYQKPWLHDVEHLTRDHEGYVYWKGSHIDHWSGKLPYSEEGKQVALDLAHRCEVIEAQGKTPDTESVIWEWKEPSETQT